MSDLSKAALAIFFSTLRAVDLPTLISQRVRRDGSLLWVDDNSYDLGSFAEVILIGIGKASLPMGYALETLLGADLTRGLLVSNRRDRLPLKSEVIVAGHPLPDANSLRAGRQAIEILSGCRRDSLVIFLISGGGSALFESLISDDISLEDLQQLNRTLVECGATIEEINAVRKHFSAVKGGRLRNYMNAEAGLAFLASDVNTGDYKTLASNPLFPEVNKPGIVEGIVERYGLADRMPRLYDYLHSCESSPTGRSATQGATNIDIYLLADNGDVMETASEHARGLGYAVEIDKSDVEEPYETAVARLIHKVGDLKRANPASGICLIAGGEVSCPVRGQGFGGRNQEFALHCALKLREAGLLNSVVLSCGTDGIDGRSIAVGAIARADPDVAPEFDRARLGEIIQSNDTACWFSEYGGLIVTGPTGNNLRDLRVILCR
jgi:glycerate-2-kinase